MKKIIAILFLSITLFSCKKDKSKPKIQPAAAKLISPTNNESCNQGNVLSNPNLSTVSFSWAKAENTNSYTLVLTNLNTNATTQENVTSTSAELDIERSANFEWYVISKTSTSDLTAQSSTWSFYNAAEGVVNHVPYPASLVSPLMNDTTASTDVLLKWTGEDNDNDISEYDIYLGTDKNDLTKHGSTPNTEYSITLLANTNYFWQVYTKDNSGNISISSVFEFTTSN